MGMSLPLLQELLGWCQAPPPTPKWQRAQKLLWCSHLQLLPRGARSFCRAALLESS
ncbi:hypothetical protein I79_006910 [Cricetulus griseus]|uniref:Uncharacterized protein n=1 Tax=Cricetulus griseus TaxID=10029 RepID=G3H948_CRIGR|nr:hypothetical protein I79_006910 [Cricetulus griseus]